MPRPPGIGGGGEHEGSTSSGLTHPIDRLERRERLLDLFLVSALGLFLEVLLIRWHATELRAAAYFKNVTLLAAFLGLGLGFARASRPGASLGRVSFLLAAQVVGLVALAAAGADRVLRLPTTRDFQWEVTTLRIGELGDVLTSYAVFFGFFSLLYVSTILVFVPIGQWTGRLMRGLRPIEAYTWNIAGSLVGVGAFTLVSAAWLPPVGWFAIAGGLLLFLLRHDGRAAAAAGASFAALFTILSIDVREKTDLQVYSPYQRLEIRRDVFPLSDGRRLDTGVQIDANRSYHLRAVDLSDAFVDTWGDRLPLLRAMRDVYEIPYAFGKAPERVLVLGAGGGNDVAAALRKGAGQVDAVEIDPAIAVVGRRFHPERPYDDPRVRLHATDARAFLRHAPSDAYDVVVFALLDSHTLLSGMSAVRLDNFVYTAEALAEARRVLAPKGILTLSFYAPREHYLATRLHRMLEDAFGRTPRTFRLDDRAGFLFATGGGVDGQRVANESVVETKIELESGVPPATDDWPFLYLRGHRLGELPESVFVLVVLLASISLLWVRAETERRERIDPHFFFLGAAFLLIEVKGITELALVFGTTWTVNSVVIAAILVQILLANLFVTLFPKQRPGIHYGLLVASLVLGWLLPVGRLLDFGFGAAAVGATILLFAPLFFAGVIFATSLRYASSLPGAFASNLLGAILGGFLEYASMAIGFRSLYLVAIALYVMSAHRRPRAVEQPT